MKQNKMENIGKHTKNNEKLEKKKTFESDKKNVKMLKISKWNHEMRLKLLDNRVQTQNQPEKLWVRGTIIWR